MRRIGALDPITDDETFIIENLSGSPTWSIFLHMSTKIIGFLILVITFKLCFGAEEAVNPIVSGEYVKVQNELSASLAQAKKNQKDLLGDRKRAILDSQSQAKVERQGIEALKKYDLLLTIRYSDDKGVYQPGNEISLKDQENLNKMFETYMRSTPLFGRISVGHARKIIDWGIKRLEDLSKVHGDPTDANNPELEIIAQQTRDADQKIKTVTELASRLGVKLHENVAVNEPEAPAPVATMPTAPKRAPASVHSNR